MGPTRDPSQPPKRGKHLIGRAFHQPPSFLSFSLVILCMPKSLLFLASQKARKGRKRKKTTSALLLYQLVHTLSGWIQAILHSFCLAFAYLPCILFLAGGTFILLEPSNLYMVLDYTLGKEAVVVRHLADPCPLTFLRTLTRLCSSSAVIILCSLLLNVSSSGKLLLPCFYGCCFAFWEGDDLLTMS